MCNNFAEHSKISQISSSLKVVLTILYDMLQRGDRECHIVVLCDDDIVDWDNDYPPQMGEDNPQSKLHSLDYFILLLPQNFEESTS